MLMKFYATILFLRLFMFEGKAVRDEQLDNGVVELVFDYVEESVNKFDRTAPRMAYQCRSFTGKRMGITGLWCDQPKLIHLALT